MSVVVGKAYYIGTCSHPPFNPSHFPQSLNVEGGRARLDNFDASVGNLWVFRVHRGFTSSPEPIVGSRNFTLACMNYDGDVGEPMFLGPDLTVVPDEGHAQLWEISQVADPLALFPRTVPGEVAMRIHPKGSEKILCSNERRRTVHLLRPKEAALIDPVLGRPIFNHAWEVIPDEDPPPEVLEAFFSTDLAGGD
mmetsp:Transcript_128430/g.363466  ORF Transcript_128430/g.363466 Transcript_128430/m.363466 type:complete len:194 (-) Transcript_128430:62-643(-)